ncbi:hypothetical protein JCM11491_003714 [Sporobolomyces phaffii]
MRVEVRKPDELTSKIRRSSPCVVCTATVPWTVPSPLAPVYAYFPLVTVSNDSSADATTPAPARPTLWLAGPPPAGHRESLDPQCRAAQALARFSELDAADAPRYLSDGLGAPGGRLPCLHLPDGDLVEADRVTDWIVASSSSSSSSASRSPRPATHSNDDADKDKVDDPVVEAYTSLVETTLLPAVVAAVYLVPSGSAPPVVPVRKRPFLADLAARWLGVATRNDRIADVHRLRGTGTGTGQHGGAALDLDEVERDAVTALEALEAKAQEHNGIWFLPSTSPTRLDALLYALVSIIAVLPAKGDSGLLRTTLERCPTLTRWYKSHEP